MDVPALGDARPIERIFDVRVQTVVAAAEELDLLEAGAPAEAAREASSRDVFEPGFADVLFDYYRANDQNVRSVLTVAEQAVKEAIGRGESIVTVAAVREAALANSR
jgi:hypothetical protein